MMGRTRHLLKEEYRSVAEEIQKEIDRRYARVPGSGMCTWKFIARPVIEKGAGISFLPPSLNSVSLATL